MYHIEYSGRGICVVHCTQMNSVDTLRDQIGNLFRCVRDPRVTQRIWVMPVALRHLDNFLRKRPPDFFPLKYFSLANFGSLKEHVLV